MFVDKKLSESLINNENDNDMSAQTLDEGDNNMTNLIKIPKIDPEADKMQPIEIYLDSCKLFAWQNLKYDVVKIDPLTFTSKHLQENVLIEKITDAEIKRYNFLNRVSEVGARYESVDLWNFMELIFVNYNTENKDKDNNSHKQHMLVKTWEQHSCLVPNAMIPQPFYVKTIRIYDLQNRLIDTKFVEKIEGNFSGENIYDVSLLHFKSKIYYFKRVWRTIGQEEFQTEGSPAKVNQSLISESQDSNYVTAAGAAGKGSPEQMSLQTATTLVLHSYDIITREEEVCLNRQNQPYAIDELAANQGHVHEDGTKHYNLNVTFSKEFGAKLSTEDAYEDEINFLDDQYICCQAYIEKSQNAQFSLYCLGDLSKPIHHTAAEECLDPNSHDHTLMLTKQIQCLNHIRTDQHDSEVLVFILINTYSHLHFHYNPATGHIEVFKYDNQNIFNKTENSTVMIQKTNAQYDDQNGEQQHHEQYFFVDYNNQIQLLYPNFDQKSQKFLITDIVSNGAKIPQTDARYFKKINRVHANALEQDTESEAGAKDNVLQEIEHLRKILNFKSISKDQIFTFCSDHRDQLLYITQANKAQVIVIQVKDHHCEECYDNNVEDYNQQILAKVSSKISRSMTKGQQSSKLSQNMKKDHQHKLMGKQSRMKSLKNFLGERIPEKIEQMCQQEENNDIITIDINTQEVIVTRNEFDKKDVSRNVSRVNGGKGSMQSMEDIKIDDQDDVNRTTSNYAKIDSGAEDGQEFKLLIQNLQHEDADPREQLNIEVTYHNGRNHIFIISSVSFIDEIKRVSYFIIKKTVDQVEQLIENAYSISPDDTNLDQGSLFLLCPDDEISMIVGPQPETGLEKIKFKEIHDFKLESKIPNQNLEFEKFVDPSVVANFMCFVYQEAFSIAKNFMITLDIDTGEIVRKVPINPNALNQAYMYVNAQGFNSFKICRSGDVEHKEKVKEATWCKKAQVLQVHETIFKVFTIYLEKLGRIQAQEFVITHDEESVEVQAIGQNQIMMSKECIQNSDWNHIQNSVVLPFQHQDQNGNLKNLGCQFLLSRDNGSPIPINMIDRVFNNLYTYESQVVLVGQKKFQVNRNDQNDYIIIISARISTRIIEKKMFEQYETFSILRGAQEIMIEMRRPDLEYILLNTFQILKENDFFVSQEMLLGKSICDICLSDSRSVREALANYKQERSNINCSIVFQLVKGDELRKEAFKEIKFYPKNQVIKYDFNFDTTINMGLRMQSIKSVVMLLNFIMEEINTQEYVELIMLDLHEIFAAKIINLNQFFGESASELVMDQVGATEIGVCSEERQALGYCNIEIPLENDDLAIFSQHDYQFETITQFENIHEIRDELIDLINERQKRQQTGAELDMASSKEIEHTYIDLKFLIIGDKIKHLDDEESLKKLSYDDEYLAKLMMSSEENSEFYMQESVQKIIDYQFVQTKKGMTYLFWFYIFCYMIPYSITLVNDNVLIHLYVMRICVLPQVVLLIIEIIQMKESGFSYFQGWNFIDLMQIMVFFNMFLVVQRNAVAKQNGVAKTQEDEEADSPWLPFIKIFLVILSFVKSLHFLTVFEELGFFVIMVLQSFIDLIPFVISYLFFQSFFATVFAVLKVDIDGEVASGVGLGYFLSLYLMVWRNSVGKLGLQSYRQLNQMPRSTLLYINIELIWLAYFVQVIFMLVIMLNFIIAIIDQTYVAVNKNKNMHVYMNKAELNEEYYQLAKYFKELKQFRVIVFSTSKEMYDEINESKEEEEKRDLMESFRRFIGRENEQNFQLQVANASINKLLQRQQDFEFQMDAEIQRYSKYLKDFKQKTLKKIEHPQLVDESMVSESRSELQGSNVPKSTGTSAKYDQQVFSQGAYTFRNGEQT